MASTSEEDVEKARVAGTTVSNETREEIRNTTLVELSGLNFGLVGQELAAELFMDIAFSSPYVGLVHPRNGSLLDQFCISPQYWLSINTSNLGKAETLYDDVFEDIVAYLEYKDDEVKAESAAQQDHHSDDESSESEAVKDVPCFDNLNGISDFHDFQYEVWEEARRLVEEHERGFHSHKRGSKDVGGGRSEHTKKQKANAQK